MQKKNKNESRQENGKKNSTGCRENNRATGSRYEELAAAYLKRCGYMVLERNFACRRGEIDIIAREGNTLVFVEVKYRKDEKAGDPAEAVDFRKQEKIRNTAAFYLYLRGISQEQECRFDVVAVLGTEVRLIKDAF